MHPLTGGCYCRNIVVELGLSREPGQYEPRACDCDFCRKHGAAYVSDPQGSLRILIRDPSLAGEFRQGNELADMLLCARCGVLIGALYRSEGRVYATINAQAVEGGSFGMPTPVSPKQLSGENKVARWKKLWFSDVTIG
jgi:hypothetical protein